MHWYRNHFSSFLVTHPLVILHNISFIRSQVPRGQRYRIRAVLLRRGCASAAVRQRHEHLWRLRSCCDSLGVAAGHTAAASGSYARTSHISTVAPRNTLEANALLWPCTHVLTTAFVLRPSAIAEFAGLNYVWRAAEDSGALSSQTCRPRKPPASTVGSIWLALTRACDFEVACGGGSCCP